MEREMNEKFRLCESSKLNGILIIHYHSLKELFPPIPSFLSKPYFVLFRDSLVWFFTVVDSLLFSKVTNYFYEKRMNEPICRLSLPYGRYVVSDR